ncbi:MAG: hypothetical protein NVSMB45_06270 [Ginsengibacter sp.]
MTYDDRQKELYKDVLEKIKVYMEKCSLLYKDAENGIQIMWEINRTRKSLLDAEQSLYDFNNEFSRIAALPKDEISD